MIPSSWASLPDWMRIVASKVNPVLQGFPYMQLASDPNSPTAGFTYYNTTTGRVRTYDGVAAAWKDHYT
jgi:hypothetical protein